MVNVVVCSFVNLLSDIAYTVGSGLGRRSFVSLQAAILPDSVIKRMAMCENSLCFAVLSVAGKLGSRSA